MEENFDGFEDLPVNESGDFAEDAVEAEQQVEEETPASESPEPVEAEQEPQTPQFKLKVKYDRAERELSEEEARDFAEKGMNLERAVERAKKEAAQQARDAYIAEQRYEWNGKLITTEAEYKQALAEKEMREKYADQNLPEEIVQELMESRRDREERKREREEMEAQKKNQKELGDFFSYFKEVNDRAFDPQKDVIPQEVRDAIDNGESLKFAYMQYHNKELTKQLRIAKQNEENAKKTPVTSVTAHGAIKNDGDDFDWFAKGL